MDREESRSAEPAGDDIPEEELDEREYFLTGQWHVVHVLGTLRERFDPRFAPQRVLDIGCGRGRVTMAWAEQAPCVVATDRDPVWLERARSLASRRGLGNVQWVLADLPLSSIAGSFDLVHACLAAPERPGCLELPTPEQILPLLAPNGWAVLQLPHHAADGRTPEATLRGLLEAGIGRCHLEHRPGPGQPAAILYFGAPAHRAG